MKLATAAQIRELDMPLLNGPPVQFPYLRRSRQLHRSNLPVQFLVLIIRATLPQCNSILPCKHKKS